MVSRKVVRKMQTGGGPRFITGRLIGNGEFQVSTTGKTFKTRKGAERFIKRH